MEFVEIAARQGKFYVTEQLELVSVFLNRTVIVDVYLPQKTENLACIKLLLVNDGQDLPKMPFSNILEELVNTQQVEPVMVVGLYCNQDRKLEYGTADEPDYLGRGSKAGLHSQFVLNELLPFLPIKYKLPAICSIAYAGFSLGGLSALDIVWKNPDIFSAAAAFSGSFWWRSRELGPGYSDNLHRIMHNLVRRGSYAPNLLFFFQTGELDESMDRNNNGIIDSIDDTLDLIAELASKGYKNEQIKYLQLPSGKHDVATWAIAFPEFLKWLYSIK